MQHRVFYPSLQEQTSETQNLLPFLVFFIGLLFVNLFQIWYLPQINLIDGTGFDGFWYLPATLHFLPEVDDYHLFRILPATLVYGLNKLFGLGPSHAASLRMFQYVNLGAVLVGLIFGELTCRHFRFSTNRKWLYFILVFINFHVLKDSYYNPMMTDTVTFCFALALFYFSVSNNITGFVLVAILSYFTIPLMSLFYLIERILRRFDFDYEEIKWPFNITRLVSICIIGFFICLTSFVVLFLGKRTVFIYPDEINMWLWPISMVLTAAGIYYVLNLHKDLFERLILIVPQTRKIFCWEFFMVIGLFILQFTLSFINGRPPSTFAWYFVLGVPVVLTLKPLIGLFDNIAYIGIIILFFVAFLPKFIRDNKYNISLLFLTLIISLFFFKVEGRHTNIFLSLIGVLVCSNFPEKMLTRRVLLGVLGFALFFSKIWYPVHWAWFPPGYVIFAKGTDHNLFQQFPAQHYFMFLGATINHAMYFLWLIPEVLAWLYVRQLARKFAMG